MRVRCRSAFCYVNANLLVGLDRRDPRALRFASENRGCLYTVANVIEDEVHGAESIANHYGIRYRRVSRSIILEFSRISARLAEELGGIYTLSPNDFKDIDHIAMALATGARVFVTSEHKLCRWIDTFRHITGDLQCIDWRTGNCNGIPGRNKKNTHRKHEKNRSTRAPSSKSRSNKTRHKPTANSSHNNRLLHRKAPRKKSRRKTKKSNKEKRKRKIKEHHTTGHKSPKPNRRGSSKRGMSRA